MNKDILFLLNLRIARIEKTINNSKAHQTEASIIKKHEEETIIVKEQSKLECEALIKAVAVVSLFVAWVKSKWAESSKRRWTESLNFIFTFHMDKT